MKRATLMLLFVPALLAASGCIGGGVRPLAIAGRGGVNGHLDLEHAGTEVSVLVLMDAVDVSASLTHLPMKSSRDGERADLYVASTLMHRWVPIIDGPHGEALFARLGLGPSMVVMDFQDGDELNGFGACGRVTLGSCPYDGVEVQVFGEAHGWLGRDSDRFRGSYAASLGAGVSLRF